MCPTESITVSIWNIGYQFFGFLDMRKYLNRLLMSFDEAAVDKSIKFDIFHFFSSFFFRLDTKRFNDNSISWLTERKKNNPTIVSVKNSENENVIVTKKKKNPKPYYLKSAEWCWRYLRFNRKEKRAFMLQSCCLLGFYDIERYSYGHSFFYLLVKHKLSICCYTTMKKENI